MDRISRAIFGKISSIGPKARYVIITEDEFFEALPEDSEKSYSELDKTLTYLRNNGYIDIKYSRGDMYCVAWLKEYEEEIPEEKETVPFFKRIDPTLISAFAGGAIGSLIISLIFALI